MGFPFAGRTAQAGLGGRGAIRGRSPPGGQSTPRPRSESPSRFEPPALLAKWQRAPGGLLGGGRPPPLSYRTCCGRSGPAWGLACRRPPPRSCWSPAGGRRRTAAPPRPTPRGGSAAPPTSRLPGRSGAATGRASERASERRPPEPFPREAALSPRAPGGEARVAAEALSCPPLAPFRSFPESESRKKERKEGRKKERKSATNTGARLGGACPKGNWRAEAERRPEEPGFPLTVPRGDGKRASDQKAENLSPPPFLHRRQTATKLRVFSFAKKVKR